MKIVHIINYFQPQIGYQETFLAREQIKQGHKVDVITSDRYYPFFEYEKTYQGLLGKRICGSGFSTIENIPIHRLRTIAEAKFRVWLVGLEKKVLELDPDFVHVHAVLANAFRLMKMKRAGMKFKLVVDEHIVALDRKTTCAARIFNLFKIARIRKFINQVDKYVGVYRESCDILREVYKVPATKIEYIPLGADHHLFRFNAKERQEIRSQFNIDENDVVVLYTGKINSNKGIDTIIKAFDSLDTHRNVFLLMIGSVDSKFKETLLGLPENSKKNRILFQDFVHNHDLPKYYSAADLCVWGDGITISMLEAISCNRPIVVCDIPPAVERIVNRNGLCYEFGNSADLSKKLAYLIEDPVTRRAMGQRGRELIEEKFSWEIISQKFLSL